MCCKSVSVDLTKSIRGRLLRPADLRRLMRGCTVAADLGAVGLAAGNPEERFSHPVVAVVAWAAVKAGRVGRFREFRRYERR